MVDVPALCHACGEQAQRDESITCSDCYAVGQRHGRENDT